MIINLNIEDDNLTRVLNAINSDVIEFRKGTIVNELAYSVDAGLSSNELIADYLKTVLGRLVAIYENKKSSDEYKTAINNISVPQMKNEVSL